MLPRYIAIWQTEDPFEREWVDEVFGPYISAHVFDGERRLVLDNCILFEAFTHANPSGYYERFRGKNAFLCDFLDEFYAGRTYAHYRNFRGVFRNFWSEFFNPRLVKALPLGYQNGVRPEAAVLRPSSARRFVWSMLGDCKKSSRPEAVRGLTSIRPHYLRPADTQGKAEKGEYRDILLESAFVPCPMGNANVESYRTYEALECGAIPIVETRWTLDYYGRLLGDDFPGLRIRSWASARSQILQRIRQPERLDELQRSCLAWWGEYKTRLSGSVGAFLADRSAASDSPAPLRYVRRLGPVLQAVELTRHHSSRALGRRLQRQWTRVQTEGRWQEAKKAWRPGRD